MNILQISVFINIMLMVAIGVMCYRLNRGKAKSTEAFRILKELEMHLASNKTRLNNSHRDTQLATDRARKNQDRWVKFRHDMIRLYAMHEFVVIGCEDALERVATWHQLPIGEQAEWMKRGTDFVEKTYGPWVG